MTLKKGAWSGGQYVQQGRYDHNQAVANQPLVVSCASMNVSPSPNLTLTLNGRNWEETSASSRIKDVSLGGYSSSTSKFYKYLYNVHITYVHTKSEEKVKKITIFPFRQKSH